MAKIIDIRPPLYWLRPTIMVGLFLINIYIFHKDWFLPKDYWDDEIIQVTLDSKHIKTRGGDPEYHFKMHWTHPKTKYSDQLSHFNVTEKTYRKFNSNDKMYFKLHNKGAKYSCWWALVPILQVFLGIVLGIATLFVEIPEFIKSVTNRYF